MTHTVTFYDCIEFLRHKGYLIEDRQRRTFIAQIQSAVCERYHIPLREMTSARRSREVARPRQVAMYLSKALTHNSLPEIGRRFGGRDHTTVIHAIRQITRLRNEDPDLDDDIEFLTSQLAA